ncbi:MAG: tetratricopeptide repeat protein [Pirellulales bacterium]|nr:tetratricopeptide repeat protein [Pirellulales bacterium]
MLAVVVGCVFGQTLAHELLYWDDIVNITNNPHLTPQVDAQGLIEIWRSPYAGLYVPVTYTFFAGEMFIAQRVSGAQFMKPAAWVFHLGNVLLHLGCAWLVFGLLHRLTQQVWPAAAGAMFFAVHPLQVEAVAWATEAKTLLAAFFGLAAIRLYLVSCAHRRWTYLPALACFVLAVLAKPTAVVVPLLAVPVALLDQLSTSGVRPRSVWQHLGRLSPWMAAALFLAWRTKTLQPNAVVVDVPSSLGRFWVAADALAFYAAKLFLPLGLAMDYGRPPRDVLSQAPWPAIAAVLGLIAIVPVTARSPRALVAVLLFLLALVPVLGFVPFEFQNISTVADRYAYFALLGPALALACCLAAWPRIKIGAILAGALLVVLCGLSTRQAGYWRNDETLCRRGIAIHPASHQARANLAAVYLGLGNLDGAEAQYREALRVAFNESSRTGDLNNLAGVLIQRGQLDEAESLLNEVFSARPNDVLALGKLADIYAARRNFGAALRLAHQVCDLAPDYESAWIHLGALELDCRHLDDAENAFKRASELRQDSSQAWRGLAKVASQRGEQQLALDRYQIAIMLAPRDWVPKYELALCLYSLGQYALAERFFREAEALAPQHSAIHNNLATTLAQLGRHAEAAQHYRRALALSPELRDAQDNLRKVERMLRP